MEQKIILALMITALFLISTSVKITCAFSFGISPSEKNVVVQENQQDYVYFAVSQAESSTEKQTVSMSSDSSWVSFTPQAFDIGPGEQRYVKVTIAPLTKGNYTATITASASIPGMKVSISAKLNVRSEKPVELVDVEKEMAVSAISSANDMISEGIAKGANMGTAEYMLALSTEEFDKGNYSDSKNYAQAASDLAMEEIKSSSANNRNRLFPLQIALLFIIIWSSMAAIITIYELSRAFRHKPKRKKMEIVKGQICPECGKSMGKAYDGLIVQKFMCLHCGYDIIKTR